MIFAIGYSIKTDRNRRERQEVLVKKKQKNSTKKYVKKAFFRGFEAISDNELVRYEELKKEVGENIAVITKGEWLTSRVEHTESNEQDCPRAVPQFTILMKVCK